MATTADPIGQPDSATHSVSVAAVIVGAQDLVLVIQRSDDGRWEPPGGVLERNERIEDGLRREVSEETGIKIEPECLTGIYKHTRRGIVALVFRCRILGGRLRLSEETRSMRWMTPSEVVESMDPVFSVRVLDALQTDPTSGTAPFVRDHDGLDLLAS